MISILAPAFNSERLLREILARSIALHSSVPVELIVYDNGGNGDLRALEATPGLDVTVLGDGVNIGLNRALNQCAARAKHEYLYLAHTDMYLMPNWDLPLIRFARTLPAGNFLLCSRSIEPTQGHTRFHIIRDYGRDAGEFAEERLLADFRNYSGPEVVTGYRMPFFLDRELWSRMGGVDPRLFSYCTDDDLVQTAYHSGVRRFGMVMDSLVYHLQGRSNREQSVDRDSAWPYDYFVSKWRTDYGEADDPSTWHPRLIPQYLRVL